MSIHGPFFGLRWRSVPNVGRTKSRTNSPTWSVAETSVLGRVFLLRHGLRRLARLSRPRLEIVSSPGISLLFELNSLFLVTGNLALCWRNGWGISDPIAPKVSDIRKLPCIFPTDQGNDRREEFLPDSAHRH